MIGLIELVGDVHRLKDLERLDLVTGEFHYLYAGRWWWRRHWNYAQNSFDWSVNRGIRSIWVSGGNGMGLDGKEERWFDW